MTELGRDLALLSVPGDGRRLPLASRLRTAGRAGAQARLAPLGLDLDRPEDTDAVVAVLGSGPTRLSPARRGSSIPRSSSAAVASPPEVSAVDRYGP